MIIDLMWLLGGLIGTVILAICIAPFIDRETAEELAKKEF